MTNKTAQLVPPTPAQPGLYAPGYDSAFNRNAFALLLFQRLIPTVILILVRMSAGILPILECRKLYKFQSARHTGSNKEREW